MAYCKYKGECFARTQRKECKALTDTYFKNNICHFQKQYGDITDGKRYPYDTEYESYQRRGAK